MLYGFFWWLLTFRPFGRHIYAVGNSVEVATLAGIDARRVRITTYAIMGALVGLGSLLYVGRLGSVEITVGIDLGISAIAAVVIGGTSITGGRGSVIGTLAGVFFMANWLLATAAVTARTAVPIRTLWAQDVGGVAANLIGLAPIAWLAAQTFQLPHGVGWWATPLFVVPLFTTRLAYARYVETRELFEHIEVP